MTELLLYGALVNFKASVQKNQFKRMISQLISFEVSVILISVLQLPRETTSCGWITVSLFLLQESQWGYSRRSTVATVQCHGAEFLSYQHRAPPNFTVVTCSALQFPSNTIPE